MVKMSLVKELEEALRLARTWVALKIVDSHSDMKVIDAALNRAKEEFGAEYPYIRIQYDGHITSIYLVAEDIEYDIDNEGWGPTGSAIVVGIGNDIANLLGLKCVVVGDLPK